MRKIVMVLEAVKVLSDAIQQKNEVIVILKDLLEEQKKFNKDVMDRIMSRDFQDYQINQPLAPIEIPPLPPLMDEDLAGDIVTDEDLK